MQNLSLKKNNNITNEYTRKVDTMKWDVAWNESARVHCEIDENWELVVDK